jgi:hypothetical protein
VKPWTNGAAASREAARRTGRVRLAALPAERGQRRQPTLDDPRYVRVIDDEGDEVARIELDDEGFETTNFAGAPELGEERLEIQFFEVSSHRRGRGIGTSVVGLLAKMYPGRRLCALSVGADCFWASLEWNRYEHVGQTARGPQYSPLFVQPLT